MMKRILPLLLGLTIALTACSVDEGSTPDSDANVPTTEEEFLFDLNSAAPELDDVTDAAMVELGHVICQRLGEGMSIDTVIATGVASGLGDNAIAATIAAAIVNFCPAQEAALDPPTSF